MKIDQNWLLIIVFVVIIYFMFFNKKETFSSDQPSNIQDAFKTKYPNIKYKSLECLNQGKIYLPDGTCISNDEARQMML